MAIKYQIDTYGRIAYVKASEETSFFPSVEAIRSLAGDKNFQPGFSVLVDLRAVESVPTVSEARAFASLLSDNRVFKSRLGLVVSERGSAGINQMASAITRHQGARINAFDCVAEAKAWLEENMLFKKSSA